MKRCAKHSIEKLNFDKGEVKFKWQTKINQDVGTNSLVVKCADMVPMAT